MEDGLPSPQSPGPSHDDDDTEGDRDAQPWNTAESTMDAESKTDSPSSTTPMSGNVHKPPIPIQKRRRVTRACDECRRKKIKCDGKQPCTHCTVYSYECTYDQPSNRRRNPAPQYIEALENRLHKAEAILRSVIPDIDLDDPKYDARGIEQVIEMAAKASRSVDTAGSVPKPEEDARIQAMIDQTGSLDLDDQGYWDFHGHSSGFAFMRKLRSQFGDSFAHEYRLPARKHRSMNGILESPTSENSSPYEFAIQPSFDLPSREFAIELCRNTLDDCCALMRFLHRPTFFKKLHKIYDTGQEHYDDADTRFLPQLYIVLALGCLFSKTENEATPLDVGGYQQAIEQGYQYFNAGRQMIDITDCRDLSTLQTVVFMIIFLQSTAKLATCYAFLGIALRACCRLGIHRNIEPAEFNVIEREERRRIFWMIRKFDTYVGTMLGLPQMLSEEDIDQVFPTEVADECIFDDEIRTSPTDPFPLLKATNAHTRLTGILRKVVRFIYPLKGYAKSSSDREYSISHARIREIERDLQKWMDDLPTELRPSENAGDEVSRVQQLLRMSYAHVQMMLYRPFIHYVSQGCEKSNIDKRSYACAAACISVARNIVHITTEMKKRGLLVGAYWFVMYTTYFAILSLVFFVLGNPESPTAKEILKDAMEGRDTLAALAKRSLAADRCTHSLAKLFKELPEKLQERRTSLQVSGVSKSNSTSRKRPQPSLDLAEDNGDFSAREVSLPRTNEVFASPSRARTFPRDLLDRTSKRNSVSNPLQTPSYSFSDKHLQQQSGQTGMVNYGTPSSSTSGLSQAPFSQQLEDPNLPDLRAVMFPSDNPFAYPNQPMSILEATHYMSPEEQPDSFSGTTSEVDILNGIPNKLGNSHLGQDLSFNELSMPMFGKGLPPHFQTNRAFSTPMTGGQNFDMSQMEEPATMGELQGSQEDYWAQMSKAGGKAGLTSGGVNLDELFGGDGWSNVWHEQ